MKCITVRQPWAWLIVSKAKTVENRSWAVKYRGPLLIHAATTRPKGRKEMGPYPGLIPTLPYGAIVGVATLVGIVPVARVADVPFASGPLCWMLEDPRMIRPVPWKGQLRPFEVPIAHPRFRPADREMLAEYMREYVEGLKSKCQDPLANRPGVAPWE